MGVNGAKIPLGYHGVIEAVCDTGEIHRLQIVTDIGKGPGRINGKNLVDVGMELDIRYAPYSIAEASYLLPSRAILRGVLTQLSRAPTSTSTTIASTKSAPILPSTTSAELLIGLASTRRKTPNLTQ